MLTFNLLQKNGGKGGEWLDGGAPAETLSLKRDGITRPLFCFLLTELRVVVFIENSGFKPQRCHLRPVILSWCLTFLSFLIGRVGNEALLQQ